MPRQFPITVPPGEDDERSISYHISNVLERYTGSTLVVGDTVFLSDEGVEVLASTDGSYYAVNAYSFRDSDGDEIGGMYGREDEGQNVVGFRVVDEAGDGDDTLLQMVSAAGAAATAYATLAATVEGESTDTYISLEKTALKSEIDIMTKSDGRVRIYPKMQLLGASAANCYIYIKGTNLIIKYFDSPNWRYKYLDLSGTGTTWSHSTSEP